LGGLRYPGLYCKFQISLSYVASPCFRPLPKCPPNKKKTPKQNKATATTTEQQRGHNIYVLNNKVSNYGKKATIDL
jgi:hypothetical protein